MKKGFKTTINHVENGFVINVGCKTFIAKSAKELSKLEEYYSGKIPKGVKVREGEAYNTGNIVNIEVSNISINHEASNIGYSDLSCGEMTVTMTQAPEVVETGSNQLPIYKAENGYIYVKDNKYYVYRKFKDIEL